MICPILQKLILHYQVAGSTRRGQSALARRRLEARRNKVILPAAHGCAHSWPEPQSCITFRGQCAAELNATSWILGDRLAAYSSHSKSGFWHILGRTGRAKDSQRGWQARGQRI